MNTMYRWRSCRRCLFLLTFTALLHAQTEPLPRPHRRQTRQHHLRRNPLSHIPSPTCPDPLRSGRPHGLHGRPSRGRPQRPGCRLIPRHELRRLLFRRSHRSSPQRRLSASSCPIKSVSAAPPSRSCRITSTTLAANVRKLLASLGHQPRRHRGATPWAACSPHDSPPLTATSPSASVTLRPHRTHRRPLTTGPGGSPDDAYKATMAQTHDQLYQGFYATIRRYFPAGTWKPEYEQYPRILYAPTLSADWPRLAMVQAIYRQITVLDPVVYDWAHIKMKALVIGARRMATTFPRSRSTLPTPSRLRAGAVSRTWATCAQYKCRRCSTRNY